MEAVLQVKMDAEMKEQVACSQIRAGKAYGIAAELANPALIGQEKGAFAKAMALKEVSRT